MSDVDEMKHRRFPTGSARYPPDPARWAASRLLLQEFHEAESRPTAVHLLAGLELVRDRLDDRDPETALGESVFHWTVAGSVEPGTVVGDLDDEPVVEERVDDLDRALTVVVTVSHGVRAGLRHRELHVAERLLAQPAQPGEPAQRQPHERDVFGLRRNRQPNGRAAEVGHGMT